MSLTDYAEYEKSPQIANTPQTSMGNPSSFSIAWTGKANAMGDDLFQIINTLRK